MRKAISQKIPSSLNSGSNMRLKLKSPLGKEGEHERFRALLQSEAYRRHRDQGLSTADYTRFMTGTEDDDVVASALAKCKDSTDKSMSNGFSFSWDDIIAWIDDHWFEILKLVLTVAILFLEPKPEDN